MCTLKQTSVTSLVSDGGTFPITVDYGRNIQEMVKGRYSKSWITCEHFPSKRNGTVEVVVEIVHFNYSLSTEDLFREFSRIGCRPVEPIELLFLGKKYHHVQWEFPIVALGSVWQSSDGDRRVVYFPKGGLKCGPGLYFIQGNWDESWRFAVVREQSSS